MLAVSKIKPLGNQVLVKRSAFKKTSGGILLPESAQEKPKEGEVIAVGPGKKDKNGNFQPLTVEAGSKVLFSSYSGTELQIDAEDYLIISEDDIIGILENN